MRFDFSNFLVSVKSLKQEFDINPVRRSNDKARRRITRLVVDEFLRNHGDNHDAFFLESDLYRALKRVNLSCNPTPEEIRIRELPTKQNAKIRNFDPLKLVSENFEPEIQKPYWITKTILKILINSEDHKDGISGDNLRGAAPQTFKHLQKDTRLFTKQARSSLYRAD